jgi:hypothetical protein
VGQAIFRGIRTRDGAPLIGTPRNSKAVVIAGLGEIGVFLAPAIARHLGGASGDEERAWFAAHENGRASARAKVAESATETIEPEPVE